jgi:hypothetical protein
VTRDDDAAQLVGDDSYTPGALATLRIHNLRALGGVRTNCR